MLGLLSRIGAERSFTTPTFFSLVPLLMSLSRAPCPILLEKCSSRSPSCQVSLSLSQQARKQHTLPLTSLFGGLDGKPPGGGGGGGGGPRQYLAIRFLRAVACSDSALTSGAARHRRGWRWRGWWRRHNAVVPNLGVASSLEPVIALRFDLV